MTATRVGAAGLACGCLLGGVALASAPGAVRGPLTPEPGRLTAAREPTAPEIATHDNRAPAGRLGGGVLEVRLVAEAGDWYPEGREGPAHRVFAFGEEGRGPTNPGPAIRVPAGTEVRATVRNALPADPLVVHGLHDRPGPPDTVQVAAGGTREVRFRVSAPGTYYYWGTARGARLLRDRVEMDTQLHGALIVDPRGPVPADEVFVIGLEGDDAEPLSKRRLRAVTVNGRSWPHVPVRTVRLGDTVRMRWINASDRRHPMHLHGFYFRVDARGDAARDTLYDPSSRRLAVTEPMAAGGTFAMTWVPTRPGNWLFHCHMATHVSPRLRLGHRGDRAGHAAPGGLNHTLDAMAGLVTGWRVLPDAEEAEAGGGGATLSAREAIAGGEPEGASPEAPADEPRRLRLLVQAAPRRYGGRPGLGFVFQEGAEAPAPDSVVIPGAPLVLRRGEPVAITVVNRLAEPTSVHWHGIELDSYYDGVSGFSGHRGRITPPVEAGDSLVVRFTPPRAGTFIYHSHFDEERQLASGLYGALLVLEPGAAYDPEADRSWVLAQAGPLSGGNRVTLNGARSPDIELEEGRAYRIRLININPSVPLVLSLLSDSLPASWRPVAKDGADLPAPQTAPRPTVQLITVGETYDFELVPDAPGDLRIEARDPLGVLELQGTVRVRPARGRAHPPRH